MKWRVFSESAWPSTYKQVSTTQPSPLAKVHREIQLKRFDKEFRRTFLDRTPQIVLKAMATVARSSGGEVSRFSTFSLEDSGPQASHCFPRRWVRFLSE